MYIYAWFYRERKEGEPSLRAQHDAIQSLRLATFYVPIPFQTGDANETIHHSQTTILAKFSFLPEAAVEGWVPLAF